MFDEEEWFGRVADVPGIGYAGSSRVDRSKLSAARARPIKSEFGSDMWSLGDGRQTSVPPAGELASTGWEGSSEDLLLRLERLLELPGYPTSYHFGIQRCMEVLWKRRVAEPQLLADLEKFFWLDIQLVQARPRPFMIDASDPSRGFAMMYSFRRLFDVYLTEGYIPEALAVARLCEEFGQGSEALETAQFIRDQELKAEAARS
jgi:hypothetical protein